ncbi:unnamed protein product [Protopolystoma xenopodis]|uniref:Uncharacterized protein n=1 Tax=Protopolystoma xenopodis TaxID=117903 RepID=A0A3S5BZW1_9PLAT|nr:unnamed protein product [Protopolystoma xenopodis]
MTSRFSMNILHDHDLGSGAVRTSEYTYNLGSSSKPSQLVAEPSIISISSPSAPSVIPSNGLNGIIRSSPSSRSRSFCASGWSARRHLWPDDPAQPPCLVRLATSLFCPMTAPLMTGANVSEWFRVARRSLVHVSTVLLIALGRLFQRLISGLSCIADCILNLLGAFKGLIKRFAFTISGQATTYTPVNIVAGTTLKLSRRQPLLSWAELVMLSKIIALLIGMEWLHRSQDWFRWIFFSG